MIKINIDDVISSLQNHYKFFEREWCFESWKNKVTYKNLDVLLFGKLLFCWDEIRILGAKKQLFLDNYIWIYKSENLLIREIKNEFINKVLEKIWFCTFCWKSSLIKFEKWRVFDLDHISPKSVKKDKEWNAKIKVYPHMAINLWNLIPACKWCNFIKSNKNFIESMDWKIFHPYFWWLSKKADWTIATENTDFDSNFNFVGNADLHSLHWEHSKFFKLPQIYLNSQDTFNTFRFIQDKRNKMKAEKNHYAKNSWKDTVEMKNYFFKNYYPKSEKDILKFANGKLKKDLIQNLYLDEK